MRFKALWRGSDDDEFWHHLLQTSLIACDGTAADADLCIVDFKFVGHEKMQNECHALMTAKFNILIVISESDATEHHQLLSAIPFAGILVKDKSNPSLNQAVRKVANGLPFHDVELLSVLP